MPSTTTITIRLPTRVRAELVADAERAGLTLADHVRRLIQSGRESGADDARLAAMEARLADRLARIERALQQFEAVG
jgi:uncharacterized protein (DUF1786 family)